MSETLYYLDDFSDEIMPCEPSLAAWAEWLSKPDPEFGRAAPADDGVVFSASVLIVLGDRLAVFSDGAWRWVEPPPEGSEQFFLRPYEGATGWDAGFSADDLDNATSGLADWQGTDPVWFACTKTGPDVKVRFHADGPRCVVEPVN